MKRNFKFLIICMVAMVLLAGCKNGNSSPKVENKNTNANSAVENSKEQTSKVKENLKLVDGAVISSMSSCVEDREIWKDFVDEKYIDFAKRDDYGIHLPRILLDSKDAKAANDEIDGLVKVIKDLYATHKKDMEDFEIGIYSSFSVYQDENVLSVMVEVSNIWEGEFPIYGVYNFSLPDGKFINDEELMKNFGTDKEEILGMIENGLSEEQSRETNLYYRDVTDSSYIYNPSNYTGKILNDIWDSYDYKNSQIFIDEMGTPNFVFFEYSTMGMGLIPTTLKLKIDRFDRSEISDEYLRMARRLGVDPKDNKYKAFVIYLGSAYDEATLKAPLEKLFVWTSIFTNYEDPQMLISMKDGEVGDRPYLNGEECYLVIPKYKNASVSLKELELSEDGKLKEVENIYLDAISSSGTTFIMQNISDIAPNGKITIRYRDDTFEFSPSTSLKDGSLMLPDEIKDGEDILDWNSLVNKETYSQMMFDRIMSIMGVG
ncbi:hypothetical protein [Peptoniphilus raoultii]|uniref:hypothetical protein n=1 Tax=Peptoniphilus raoultii TaxID=1776387 RepID=UPI0008DAD696|nr:hypothetical protein [Peptoniphilus raoultii]